MTEEARAALAVIQECLDDDRYLLSQHFRQRMAERGLLWPDVMAIIEAPREVRDNGLDRYGRRKWIIAGNAADDLSVEVVCVLDEDDAGDLTVFITIYYGN